MSGRPPVTPELRARASTMPNNWLHVVDPSRDPSSGEAVIGRYLVDARGRITDQYVANPRYQQREPANELEAVLRHGEPDDVLAAILGAELILPADPTKTARQHVVFRRDAQGQVVDAFTSPEALPKDWPPHWHRFTGVELAVVVDRLGEPVRLRLADSSRTTLEFRFDVLVGALTTAVG
jgi:hypothetical protein